MLYLELYVLVVVVVVFFVVILVPTIEYTNDAENPDTGTEHSNAGDGLEEESRSCGCTLFQKSYACEDEPYTNSDDDFDEKVMDEEELAMFAYRVFCGKMLAECE